MPPVKLVRPFIISIILLLLVIIVVGTIRYRSHSPKDSIGGHLLKEHDWPGPFVEFLGQAERQRIAITDLEVYRGSHDDYYLRCDFTPMLLDLMIAEWKLSAVNRRHRAVDIALRYVPPSLSSVVDNDKIDYYVSAEYLPGGEWKGHLYCAMINRSKNSAVVRYYYNF